MCSLPENCINLKAFGVKGQTESREHKKQNINSGVLSLVTKSELLNLNVFTGCLSSPPPIPGWRFLGTENVGEMVGRK